MGFLARIEKGAKLILLALVLGGCGLAKAGGRSTEVLPPGATAPVLLRRYTTVTAPTRTPVPMETPRLAPGKTSSPAQPASLEPTTEIIPSRPSETLPAPSISKICSPLEFVDLEDLSRVVSDPYRPPPKGSDERHPGVDFAYYHWKGGGPIDGTQIYSVLAGTVAMSQKNSFPYGNVVMIETPGENLPEDLKKVFGIDAGESLYLLYAHMLDGSPFVSLGETVQPCEPIGRIGKTGNAGAPHLHLENRVGPAGARFEYFSYYRDDDTAEEKQNYRLWSLSGEFLHFDPMRLLLFEYNHGATSTPKGGP